MLKSNLEKAKLVIRKFPGVKALNSLRHKVIRVRELSALVASKQIVTFPAYESIPQDDDLVNELVREMQSEWLDLYGIINLTKRTRYDVDPNQTGRLLWHPMALLRVPNQCLEYLNSLERDNRRKIRVAQREGYEFREFDWDAHLDDIYEINTSKEIRQGEPMRGWYRNPVQPRRHTHDELRHKKYLGGFKDGKLYAYFHFYLCVNIAVGKHYLGHAQHLKNGIMNGLMAYTIQECIRLSNVSWIIYGDWQKTGSLRLFKQHLGFDGYAVLLDLSRDRELLERSRSKICCRWKI